MPVTHGVTGSSPVRTATINNIKHYKTMSYNKKDRIEERVYSVTMTENELRLFSEFLEQREYSSKAQKLRRRAADIKKAEQ